MKRPLALKKGLNDSKNILCSGMKKKTVNLWKGYFLIALKENFLLNVQLKFLNFNFFISSVFFYFFINDQVLFYNVKI